MKSPPPREGMLACIRNRQGRITSVDAHGELHLVDIEYLDRDGVPADTVLWEMEEVSTPQELPDLPPVRPQRRVTLLLADEEGMGKMEEACRVLQELWQGRRVRRVLVLCPEARSERWQRELGFTIVDRDATDALHKRVGFAQNPFRAFLRAIVSHEFLRQPDVLEQLLATGLKRPWDVLIVDQAHLLMPACFGEDSDLCRMLRAIVPRFAHRLFLTAYPHNGHPRCFTGLLQLLDPLRFTQVSEFTAEDRARVGEVLVRRRRSEIAGMPRRELCPLPLPFGHWERALSQAFQAFRAALRRLMRARKPADQAAGTLAMEALSKRLLSCPAAFVEAWPRFREGLPGPFGSVGPPGAGDLSQEIAAIDEALAHLGTEDSRLQLVQQLLTERGECLVLFTGYEATRDHLLRNLSGGPVRIVLDPDGPDLHETAHLLLHYDVPWDPAGLERRNACLDRLGQRHDVSIFYFTGEDDEDLLFLDHVVRQAQEVREDLGFLREVFDTAFARRFIDQLDVEQVMRGLDQDIEARRERARQLPPEDSGVSVSIGDNDREERLQQRIRDVERALRVTTVFSLEQERDRLLGELRQGLLFAGDLRRQEEGLQDLVGERQRRRAQYQELLDLLRLLQRELSP